MGKYTKSTISLYLQSEYLVDYLRFMASQNNTTVTRYINQLVIDDYIKNHKEGNFSDELAADYKRLLAIQSQSDEIAESIKEKSKAIKEARDNIMKATAKAPPKPTKKVSYIYDFEDE